MEYEESVKELKLVDQEILEEMLQQNDNICAYSDNKEAESKGKNYQRIESQTTFNRKMTLNT